MDRLIRKTASVGLALTTAVWLTGASMVMPVAAQSVDINSLLAQIAQLQALVAQLQAQQSGGGTASSCTFTRDLTVGSTGADVKCLQQTLNANGYKITSSGAGSPGNESTYFGSLTKAAVAKWQAAKGISPAAGYFGSKSRAAMGTTSGGGTVIVPPAGTAVALYSIQPSGTLVAGGGQQAIGRWTFGGTYTLTGLTFQRVGVVSDSNISNAYIADYTTGQVLAQFSSISSGVMTFNSLNIPISGSKVIELRVDISTSAAAGQNLGWTMTSATASGATISGTPLTGPSLTVTTVNNPSLATATFTFNSVGSSVNAGTTGVLVADITAAVTNSASWLKSVKFTETGSANVSDLQNLTLKVGGTQVGSVASSVASDGSIFFDLSNASVKLGTGNTSVQLYADILGSPNRTMQFTILRTYDVNVVDSQYNAGISPTVTTTNATTITINKGQITVGLSSATPTGNIAVGVSNVTLSKFTVYASGEAVKVQFLDVKLIPNGTGWDTTAAAAADLTNVRVIDDAGNQLGSTISTLAEGSSSGQCTYTRSDSSTICHFGTSGSPINYIVPANTTRTLSAVVDLDSTVAATTLQATLPGNTSNLLGQVSNQTVSSGAATGATRTVVSSSLTSAVNSALGTPVYAKGKTAAKVGSFTLTASSAQSVNVSSLTVTTAVLQSNTNIAAIQNMKLMIGTTQFGTTQPTVSSSTAYTFSGSATVNAGGSAVVDVYADIISSSNADTYASFVSLTGWTATGGSSGSSISFDSSRTGQGVSVSSGPTLTIAADASSPAAAHLVMGSSANPVFALRLTANNVEDVKVTALTLADSLANTSSPAVTSFQQLTVWDGSTQVGGPLNLTLGSTVNSSTAAFSFATPIVVPQNGTKTLTFKGDIAVYSSGGADSGSGHTFEVYPATVTALGNSSNVSATVSAVTSGLAQGNQMRVYRSKPTLTASVVGSASGRPRTTVDDVALLTVAANSAGDVKIDSITVSFAGTLLAQTSAASGLSTTASLLDNDTLGVPSGCATTNGTATSNPGKTACVSWIYQNATGLATVSTTATYTFGTPFVVTAGTSKSFRIRLDSSTAYDTANVTENLTATVNAVGDFKWEDGTTTSISLPANVVPFIIGSGLGY